MGDIVNYAESGESDFLALFKEGLCGVTEAAVVPWQSHRFLLVCKPRHLRNLSHYHCNQSPEGTGGVKYDKRSKIKEQKCDRGKFQQSIFQLL